MNHRSFRSIHPSPLPENESFVSEFPISKGLVNRNDFGVSGTLLLSNTSAGLSNTRKGSPLENPRQELTFGGNKLNILQKFVSSTIQPHLNLDFH